MKMVKKGVKSSILGTPPLRRDKVVLFTPGGGGSPPP